jgi:hypothetical protein
MLKSLYKVTDRDLESLMEYAFTSGSIYWLNGLGLVKPNVKHNNNKVKALTQYNAEIVLYVTQDSETFWNTEKHILTRKNLLNALHYTAEYYGLSTKKLVENMNSEYADTVLQFATFGFMRYG